MSYYNPQIPDWNLECISVEREAKELSQVILIVITGQTLSVASMVEVMSVCVWASVCARVCVGVCCMCVCACVYI